ncbi:MAG: DUF4258 domain-containing protein [Deltaproteobacteria bacterium]|nr:DUF4258 domain-containing protein [Deltaproteobacteria bacterium]
MTRTEKEIFVRSAFHENASSGGNRVLWSGHATMRLVCFPWSRAEVEKALAACEIIEDYPVGHRTLPDCLVLGFIGRKRPVHAVVALDTGKNRVLVVTVYIPDRSRWKDDWQKRT